MSYAKLKISLFSRFYEFIYLIFQKLLYIKQRTLVSFQRTLGDMGNNCFEQKILKLTRIKNF